MTMLTDSLRWLHKAAKYRRVPKGGKVFNPGTGLMVRGGQPYPLPERGPSPRDVAVETYGPTHIMTDVGVDDENTGIVRGMYGMFPALVRDRVMTISLKTGPGDSFEAGGQKFEQGGFHRYNEPTRTSDITLYNMEQNHYPAEIEYTLAHEMGHAIHRYWINMRQRENELAGMTNSIVPGSALSDNYVVLQWNSTEAEGRSETRKEKQWKKWYQQAQEKYPYYTSMAEFSAAWDKADGISDYSKAWYEDTKVDRATRMGETIAELTRKYFSDIYAGYEPLYDLPADKDGLREPFVRMMDQLRKPILSRTPQKRAKK